MTTDASTSLKAVDYPKVTPLLVEAVKELATITGEFKTNLIVWLGDNANGLTRVRAAEINGGKLCAKKSDGTDVCVTGDQLAALLVKLTSPQRSPTARLHAR